MKVLRFAIPAAFALSSMMLVACEQDRQNNIPGGATMTSSGNSNLTYTAQNDGTVWVYDVNDDRIDYSGQIMANQSLVLNATNNQILVDGRVVSDKTLNQNAQHRIYFQPVIH
jgi:hypothetical protein